MCAAALRFVHASRSALVVVPLKPYCGNTQRATRSAFYLVRCALCGTLWPLSSVLFRLVASPHPRFSVWLHYRLGSNCPLGSIWLSTRHGSALHLTRRHASMRAACTADLQALRPSNQVALHRQRPTRDKCSLVAVYRALAPLTP
jgi:hypothetical protein